MPWACANPDATAPGATSSLPPDGTPALEAEFLGVGGWLLRWGDHAILTPPMYTNPDLLATLTGPIASDPAVVDRLTDGLRFDDVGAILVGHGHYDHLLDAPELWTRTPGATIYGNETVAHLLAAYAPDPPAGCEGRDPPPLAIPREDVVALDAAGLMDDRPCGGSDPGQWVDVPGARFRALCSMHPDQVGGLHFGLGSVDADVCAPPPIADDWREGQTLAFLVDFLDDAGDPAFRLYYQDAPTDLPFGLPEADELEGRRVDLALLNVGNYPVVDDQPGASIRALHARYAIGGHWEDFFVPQDVSLHPLPGHDLDEYRARQLTALGDEPQWQVRVDGVWQAERAWIPDPGTVFEVPAR
jgi:L-ascorbate metabolism protein UlaG (beta-lactamase superfamily)